MVFGYRTGATEGYQVFRLSYIVSLTGGPGRFTDSLLQTWPCVSLCAPENGTIVVTGPCRPSSHRRKVSIPN
jgi:hypothetical protein